MRSFVVALVLAMAMVTTVHGQGPSEVWQNTDRTQALQRMLAAAEMICSRPNHGTKTSGQAPELEGEFISTVRPLIRSALAGVYGVDTPFWLERVTKVQSHKKYPDVLHAVVEVQTYEGAHFPLGIDTIEFDLVPGPYLFISGVTHRQHPEGRSIR